MWTQRLSNWTSFSKTVLYEKEKDTLYYLRGNAYRKKGDWKRALDNYQYAIELNPDSPAVQARKMVIDILNFYHKDMFNQ